MLGFAAFIMIIVAGILALVGGLRLLSPRDRPALPERDDPRLDRMESALTSLESRLDDLQEQQRFLERLLERRPPGKALGAGPTDRAGRPGESDDEAADDSSSVDSILFETGEES